MAEFTNSWFSRNRHDFHKNILPVWKGKPISYLEIGVYEGASLVWMLNAVLTHPDARAVGVDPWAPMDKGHTKEQMDDVFATAAKNVVPWIEAGKCKLYRGTSDWFFINLAAFLCEQKFDIAYIDGCHDAGAVLADAMSVTRAMKPGGWIIFDDVRTNKPNEVGAGIAEWLKVIPAKLLWRGGHADCYQV